MAHGESSINGDADSGKGDGSNRSVPGPELQANLRTIIERQMRVETLG